METPLVSICSITYNHAPFIRQCLDGFLMQQCNFPIEIIINDDCSTDGTTEIIREYAEKYPDKIFPIFHEENLYSQGVRGMFQKFVFPKARGKYIALCEGDDYWTDPLKLQKQVDFLESHPECSLCCHAVGFITCEKNVQNPCCKNSEQTTIFELEQLPIPTCAALCRSECVRSIPTNPRFSVGDVVVWFACSEYGKFYNFKEEMAVYRHHGGSWCIQNRKTSVQTSYTHLQHWFAMYQVYRKPYQRKIIRRFLAKNIVVFQRMTYRSKILSAIFALFKALAYCPKEYFNCLSQNTEVKFLILLSKFMGAK